MKNIMLLGFAFFIFSPACKKDRPMDTASETPIGPDTAKSKIIYGDYSNMIVKNYNFTLFNEYNHPPVLFPMDLNDDGLNDVRFTSIYWGSPGLGHYISTSITSLSTDLQLFGDQQNDSIFKNSKITSVDTSGSKINVQISAYYSCRRIDPSDILYSVVPNNFHLAFQDQNFELKRQDLFKNDSTLCINSSPTQIMTDTKADTNFTIFTYHGNDCHNIAKAQPKFIGFKLSNSGTVKLGWIKLIYTTDNKFLIYESAIQQ
jgi:hypothetical protein